MARPVFKRGLSINQTKPNMGREDTPKLTDLVDMYDWPKKGGSGQVRGTGPVQGRGLHKVNVMKKDGSTTEITKVCLAYNVDTDEFDPDADCPYCNMPEGYQTRKKRYFTNVIDRRIEEDAPAKVKKTAEETKTGFKDVSSNSWTPARVLSFPSTFATRLQELSAKNIIKSKTGAKKAFEFNDDRFGFDLDISFDKNKPAANMYSCDRNTEERFTPLNEDQLDYLLYDLDTIYPPEDSETAKREAKSLTDRWRKATGDESDVDDDEEETDRHQRSHGNRPGTKGKRGGKPAPKGRGRQQEEEYDDDSGEGGDEELDLDGEEEGGYDEDPPPRRGGKQPPKGRGRQQEEEYDEGEEGEEDEFSEEGEEGEDEYGEEEVGEVEEYGEEEGEEEEDGYDDPPPRRPAAKKAAPQRSGRPAPRRQQEEEFDEGGEDEFEADPPPRRPAAKKAAPQRGGKPQARPAAKKSAGRRPAPASDLDELDDDIPF